MSGDLAVLFLCLSFCAISLLFGGLVIARREWMKAMLVVREVETDLLTERKRFEKVREEYLSYLDKARQIQNDTAEQQKAISEQMSKLSVKISQVAPPAKRTFGG